MYEEAGFVGFGWGRDREAALRQVSKFPFIMTCEGKYLVQRSPAFRGPSLKFAGPGCGEQAPPQARVGTRTWPVHPGRKTVLGRFSSETVKIWPAVSPNSSSAEQLTQFPCCLGAKVLLALDYVVDLFGEEALKTLPRLAALRAGLRALDRMQRWVCCCSSTSHVRALSNAALLAQVLRLLPLQGLGRWEVHRRG